MIIITQGYSNYVRITANERLTITPATYNLLLTRNNETITVNLGSDISSYKTRYNKFLLDAETCDFGINKIGVYEYLYQVIAIDEEENSEQVEQGYCQINVDTETPIFTQHNTNDTFKTND